MYNPKKKREKFATQVDSELLAKIREIAAREGRQIQSVVDEALDEYVVKHDETKPNPLVIEAHRRGMQRFASLYERLAQ